MTPITDPLILDPAALIDKYLDRARLDRYFELLMEQNRVVNLVSRETSRGDFDRMVAESLLPLDFIGTTFDSYLDIGSGGGLPAVPMILAGIGASHSTLIERTGKKAKALGQIVAGLELTAGIEPTNFAELHLKPSFQLVTLRYVKLDPRLLSRILERLEPGGKFVYYSSPDFKTFSGSAETHRFVSGQDQAVKSLTIFQK